MIEILIFIANLLVFLRVVFACAAFRQSACTGARAFLGSSIAISMLVGPVEIQGVAVDTTRQPSGVIGLSLMRGAHAVQRGKQDCALVGKILLKAGSVDMTVSVIVRALEAIRCPLLVRRAAWLFPREMGQYGGTLTEMIVSNAKMAPLQTSSAAPIGPE
jgi:hypothetical protein